jgi:hypothetical protein
MGPTTFLGLFFFLFTIGIFLKDIDKLNSLKINKYVAKLIISIICTLIVGLFALIDIFIENNHTLKKFSDYYGLRYGDTLDFNYHIKTDHKNKIKGDFKTPICKIDGNIKGGLLEINKITECDTDEDIVNKYKTIFTTSLALKDKSGKEVEDSVFIKSQIPDYIDN